MNYSLDLMSFHCELTIQGYIIASVTAGNTYAVLQDILLLLTWVILHALCNSMTV